MILLEKEQELSLVQAELDKLQPFKVNYYHHSHSLLLLHLSL